MAIPSGMEAARPFVPATTLGVSKRFCRRLGFESVLDADDVAISRMGSTSLLLAHLEADSFMMQLMVDDLDAWWERIQRLHLKQEFGVPEPRQPWGLRIAYEVEPAGVLWHVAQRRAGVSHDA